MFRDTLPAQFLSINGDKDLEESVLYTLYTTVSAWVSDYDIAMKYIFLLVDAYFKTYLTKRVNEFYNECTVWCLAAERRQ